MARAGRGMHDLLLLELEVRIAILRKKAALVELRAQPARLTDVLVDGDRIPS